MAEQTHPHLHAERRALLCLLAQVTILSVAGWRLHGRLMAEVAVRASAVYFPIPGWTPHDGPPPPIMPPLDREAVDALLILALQPPFRGGSGAVRDLLTNTPASRVIPALLPLLASDSQPVASWAFETLRCWHGGAVGQRWTAELRQAEIQGVLASIKHADVRVWVATDLILTRPGDWRVVAEIVIPRIGFWTEADRWVNSIFGWPQIDRFSRQQRSALEECFRMGMLHPNRDVRAQFERGLQRLGEEEDPR